VAGCRPARRVSLDSDARDQLGSLFVAPAPGLRRLLLRKRSAISLEIAGREARGEWVPRSGARGSGARPLSPKHCQPCGVEQYQRPWISGFSQRPVGLGCPPRRALQDSEQDECHFIAQLTLVRPSARRVVSSRQRGLAGLPLHVPRRLAKWWARTARGRLPDRSRSMGRRRCPAAVAPKPRASSSNPFRSSPSPLQPRPRADPDAAAVSRAAPRVAGGARSQSPAPPVAAAEAVQQPLRKHSTTASRAASHALGELCAKSGGSPGACRGS
jgi:hypothetical protein